VSIQVVGQPVKVFDHAKDKQESDNIPDAQITAWKEADGTVNLLIPSTEAYRMRGPNLMHLSIDPSKIYSSAQSAEQIPEDSSCRQATRRRRRRCTFPAAYGGDNLARDVYRVQLPVAYSP